ncbi:MAG TPA: NnrU family protein [Candidatus Binatia bacterium]|nr:NnrU family protein [Candidatus Binatia bacterium]
MSACVTIAVLWIVFGATHLVLSSKTLRPRLVARLGPTAFQSVYSAAVLGSFLPLLWVFFTNKHAGPLLWTTIGPADVARPLNYALNTLAIVLLVVSLVPASAAPSSLGAASTVGVVPHGILRITRHPMMAAYGCWAVAHLLVNGYLGDVLFFGGFAVWVWMGTRHQDARLTRDRPGYGALVASTSFVPFAAILARRQRLVIAELPFVSIAAGLVLAVAVRWWHGTLFGP